jgi:NAD(P)-dependent dehydrogenase (short-subunit alcohol dehydrogenase family)
MKEFAGKVAVITGAASGIGRSIAERCVQEGMSVVLADIEKTALDETANALRAMGGSVLAVPTDVAKAEEMEALARKTLSQCRTVHLLVNNAGVAGAPVSTASLKDWQWTVGVNLWGVVHGIHYFLPTMLNQDSDSHIVNTASIAGLTRTELGIYTVTKHAVVALSETLYSELAQMQARVKVSVLCPGFVRTQIVESERNRPADLQDPDAALTPEEEAVKAQIAAAVETGMPPEQVADRVFQAIENEQFYILTHPELNPMIQQRMEDILQGRNPRLPPA